MKRLAVLGCLLALAGSPALALDCAGGVCVLPGMAKGDVTTAAMKTVVAGGKAVVIDARPTAPERIPGSKVLAGTPTAEEAAKVIPSKDTPVITYCGNTRCTLSPKLAEHLKSLGYTNVREYPEGIAGWKSAGNPVEAAM
ncbi:MAG: rhodanese-like domain-containing protein [Kiritimatiellales bacterium]